MHRLTTVVYHSHCHRAWGFPGSKEIKEAGLGNLGLEDRECIRFESTEE